MKPFTSMLHHHVVLMLLSLCLPLDVNGWSFGLLHHPNSMSSPLQAGWVLPTPSQIQKKKRTCTLDRNFPTNSQSSSSNSGLASSPPLFEITDNDQEFQIAMDVPGVKREDINVDLLLDDGAVLSISGLRLHKQAGKQVKFSQSFSLDPAVVVVDKLTANLENGVLIVSAPKDMMMKKRMEEKIRQKIPIQVPADKGDDNHDDSHDAGDGTFDARNESNFRSPDPIKEEEEDLNAA